MSILARIDPLARLGRIVSVPDHYPLPRRIVISFSVQKSLTSAARQQDPPWESRKKARNIGSMIPRSFQQLDVGPTIASKRQGTSWDKRKSDT